MHKDDKKRIDELFNEYYNGNLSDILDKAIMGWIVSGDHAVEKDLSMSELFSRSVMAAKVPDQNTIESLKEVKKRLGMFPGELGKTGLTDSVHKKSKAQSMWLRAAAVLIPAAIVFSVYLAIDRSPSDPVQGRWITVSSGPDIKHMELPDNSTVEVYSGMISYPEDFSGERLVRIDGKTYFDVEKAEGRTFTVESDYFTIEVLGTAFLVHSPADTEHSTIDLYRGSIRVVAGDEEYIVEPGSHLEYFHATGETVITGMAPGEITEKEAPVSDGHSSVSLQGAEDIQNGASLPTPSEAVVPSVRSIPDIVFDWQKLIEMMEADSNYPYSRQVVSIIERGRSDAQITARLKELNDGKTYEYIAERYIVLLKAAPGDTSRGRNNARTGAGQDGEQPQTIDLHPDIQTTVRIKTPEETQNQTD